LPDLRCLSPIELADVIREHLEDEWVPYVNELERAWIQLWAKDRLRDLRTAEGDA